MGLLASLAFSQRGIKLSYQSSSDLLHCHQYHGYKCIFQAYQAVVQLVEAQHLYSSLKIPLLVIPSTISNNVPGTDFSLGCDSSLNEIVSVSIQSV